MDRPQSLRRTAAFAKGCGFSCAVASSARSRGRSSTFRSTRVLGEDEQLSRRARSGLSRQQGSCEPQDRGGREEEPCALAGPRAGRSVAAGSSRGIASTVHLRDAYRAVHAPQTPEEAAGARERFVFAEFLALATAARSCAAPSASAITTRVALRRAGRTLLERFERTLPFALDRRAAARDRRDLERHARATSR